MLHDLDQRIADLSEFRGQARWHHRITTVEHAAKTILCPALTKILPDQPDITVEIIVDYGLADVVADRLLPSQVICVARAAREGMPASRYRRCLH
jgi:DNA-binding transcriptional LysR family regulator